MLRKRLILTIFSKLSLLWTYGLWFIVLDIWSNSRQYYFVLVAVNYYFMTKKQKRFRLWSSHLVLTWIETLMMTSKCNYVELQLFTLLLQEFQGIDTVITRLETSPLTRKTSSHQKTETEYTFQSQTLAEGRTTKRPTIVYQNHSKPNKETNNHKPKSS